MSPISQRPYLLAALVAAVSLTACAGRTDGLVPQGATAASAASPGSIVPDGKLRLSCKDQSNTSEYSTSTGNLKPQGGRLCIPSFDKVHGVIGYPASSGSAALAVQVISSTTNYNSSLPQLGPGTSSPIFYIQIVLPNESNFTGTTSMPGQLMGKLFTAGQAYTLYGEAKLNGVAGIKISLTPCYTTAAAKRQAGVLSGFGSLLEGQNINGSGTIYFEVYPGEQVATAC